MLGELAAAAEGVVAEKAPRLLRTCAVEVDALVASFSFFFPIVGVATSSVLDRLLELCPVLQLG